MTIREALVEGGAALGAAGIETPGLDTSLLLAHVLETGRSALIAAGTDPLPEEALAAFRGLIARRVSGECAAYILGKKEFRALEFLVNPSVLVPRPDTETMVEAALEMLETGNSGKWIAANGSRLRVLDLCTGCGAVAISLKHEMTELEVWAADISTQALQTAEANAARLLPPDSIRFLCGNLFDSLTASLSFSLIVSNPPYIPTAEIKILSREVQKEPRLALDGGADGLDIIRKIIAKAPGYLCPGDSLLLEADPGQMKTIAGLLEKNGFTGIKTYRDLPGRERVIGGLLD
jgi:release factor glutamine methyltransferase